MQTTSSPNNEFRNQGPTRETRGPVTRTEGPVTVHLTVLIVGVRADLPKNRLAYTSWPHSTHDMILVTSPSQ